MGLEEFPPYRKPLILKGVRQVGKAWILKEFGRRYYENTAYFHFDENEEHKQFFEITKDVAAFCKISCWLVVKRSCQEIRSEYCQQKP